jgi:predicted HTH transcriptional regulator
MENILSQDCILREDLATEVKRGLGKSGKGELPKDFWETYSAFANTEGGAVLLGVAEKKGGGFEILGMENPDAVITDLWRQLNNPEKVSVNLLSQNDVRKHPVGDGKWVVEIEVPQATRQERPVYITENPLKGTYKRLGSEDMRCNKEDVRRMMAEQGEESRDARVLPGFGFEDLHMESFRSYRQRFLAFNPDHPYSASEEMEFLRQLGGWGKDRTSGVEGLTLAGLLMFGKDISIREGVPNFFLDYRELPFVGSVTDWVDRVIPDGRWPGNLYSFFFKVLPKLYRDVKVPFCLEGFERKDDTPIHKALRESFVNALAHADYSCSTAVVVLKAPEYFEFRNPGRMRVPLLRALKGGRSDCRNRAVLQMFRFIGLCEQAGSGIPRVMANWKSQHYRAPDFEECWEPESTTLRLRTISVVPEETLHALDALFGDAYRNLSENERGILATAHVENFVTHLRLQQAVDIHPRDLTLLLKSLVERGFLLSHGQGRGTTYHLAKVPLIDRTKEAGEALKAGHGALDSQDAELIRENVTHNSHHKGEFKLIRIIGPDHKDEFAQNLTLSSDHKDDFSSSITGSSHHKDELAQNLILSSDHEEQECFGMDVKLREIARPVCEKKRVSQEFVKLIILSLCSEEYLSIAQIATLLHRTPNNIRQRYIKPMLEEGLLERRFPQQPNHESQAYRARKMEEDA